MDAFEQLVADLLDRRGFWTKTSVKVDLTSEEKRAVGRPSSPRWELDVVGYHGATNQIWAVECKSYLDSPGVRRQSFSEPDSVHGKRFKLFNEAATRRVVLSRLAAQLEAEGRCRENPEVVLALAAANIRNADDHEYIKEHFGEQGWVLIGPDEIKKGLAEMEQGGYENSVAAITAKLLLRR